MDASTEPSQSAYTPSKDVLSTTESPQVTEKKRKRKKKVEMACVYCRRSHMICDDSRPCQRCVKRGISHLCHDEPSNPRQLKKAGLLKQSLQPQLPNNASPPNSSGNPPIQRLVLSKTMPYNQEPFFYSEHAGSEFSSLNEFLSMIDDPDLVNSNLENPNADMLAFGMNELETSNSSNTALNNILSFLPGAIANLFEENRFPAPQQHRPQTQQPAPPQPAPAPAPQSSQDKTPVISDLARDKFFLTAADPTTEISPEERLKQVIKAKLEAGLLQPYNYAKGYARLQSYMDNYMNVSSRQRILKPLSIFRPAFRAIARTLKDVDLVLVEESFERMLLDYDRVFTSMAIPACLWRRTGEIYRGNKEFASLVGVMTDDLKDGKLAIYELMSEESAVNFWEKYGAIAFDKGQKAVLTSCNLRTKDGLKRKSCCFSFTIRRDRYNIPSCIVGNFIPIDP